MRKRTITIMAALLAAIALFGLCRSVLAKSPVVIGATVSKEGRYADPSGMIQKALELWVIDVNQRRGLLGRKVELRLYDDKSRVDLAVKYYRKLVEEDNADLVLSPYSTPLTLAASEISERHEMLMLSIAAGADRPWERRFRYLFQLYAPARRQFIGLLDMMARRGLKSIALLYDKSSDYNVDTIMGILEWAERFKMSVIFSGEYTEGKAELPRLLEKVRSRNPDGLILAAYPPDAYEMLKNMTGMGYRPPVLAMPLAPAHPDFYARAGRVADHVFSPSQWEPDERIHFPGTSEFVERFREAYGQAPTFHAASAYAACQLLEQTVKSTKTLDNRVLRDYIATLNTVTVLGRFKVDSTGKQIGHNSFIIQWQNGKKEIVWPYNMQTAAPVFEASKAASP